MLRRGSPESAWSKRQAGPTAVLVFGLGACLIITLGASYLWSNVPMKHHSGMLQHSYYYERVVLSLLMGGSQPRRDFNLTKPFALAQTCLRDSPFVPGPVPPPLLSDPQYDPNDHVDLEAHYKELMALTASFREASEPLEYASYKGPWLENHWLAAFCCDRPLSDFGGMIPLFVRWTDLAPRSGMKWYLSDNFLRFKAALRKDVIYVTVSQSADGINSIDKLGFSPSVTWNVFVLSAGGFGHVPLPLIMGERPLVPVRATPTKPEVKKLFAFAGSTTWVMPMRNRLKAIIEEVNQTVPFAHSYIQSTPDWADLLDSGLLALAPRGYGRTSFRMYEIVQMGLVPTYVWDDDEWIPYRGSPRADLSQIGLSIQIDGFKDWLLNMIAKRKSDPGLSFLSLDSRREKLRLVRESHFTYAGVIQQIGKFLKDPSTSELRCQRHPSNTFGNQMGLEE